MNSIDLDKWFGGDLGGLTVSEAQEVAARAEELMALYPEWTDTLLEALGSLDLKEKYYAKP